MEAVPPGPDERALRAHLERPEFKLGQAQGRWALRGLTWPFVLIGVTASDSTEFLFRFECTGYPNPGPTAGLWDPATDAIPSMENFPLHHGGRVSHVFRTEWCGGSALYHPCDRVAIASHPDWHAVHPSKLWVPENGIVQYLEFIHELLNSADYQAHPRP